MAVGWLSPPDIANIHQLPDRSQVGRPLLHVCVCGHGCSFEKGRKNPWHESAIVS